MSTLFVRALIAFLALPGMVAFVAPWLIARRDISETGFAWIGLAPLGFGAGLLLWCVREFYVAGRGTLAPWSPPIALVVSGPYAVSRNPMYLGVTLILGGWAVGFRSMGLARIVTDHGDTADEWVPAATCNFLHEAHLLQSVLEADGIEARCASSEPA